VRREDERVREEGIAMTRHAGPWHIDIDRGTCLQCAGCVSICPTRALDMLGLELQCEDPLCIGCDLCVRFCPVVSLTLEPRQPQALV